MAAKKSGSANRKAKKARDLTERARQEARAAGGAEPGPGPNAKCDACQRAFPHVAPDPWDDVAAPDLSRPELLLLWANKLGAVTLYRAVRDPFLTDEEKYRRIADFLAKLGMVRDKVKTQGLVEELEAMLKRARDQSGGTEPVKPGSWKKTRAAEAAGAAAGDRPQAGAPGEGAAEPARRRGASAGPEADG